MRTVPNAYKLVALAVFAIYFTLPLIALSALPVKLIDGEYTTLLALPPEEGGYANDPILGLVENLGLEGAVARRARDLRRRARGDDPRSSPRTPASSAPRASRTRWRPTARCRRSSGGSIRASRRRVLSLVVFAGIAPIADPAPGRRQLRRHALLARRDALVHRRARVARPDPDRGPRRDASCRPTGPGRTSVSAASTGRCSRIVGGLATGVSFLVIVVQNPPRAGSGSAGSCVGLVGYVVYRRRWRARAAAETVKAPPAFGAGARARVPAHPRPGRARAGRPTTRSTSPAASRPSAARGSSR